MTINERIKLVRSNAGLTLVEFGKKIGLTKSTVSRMEQIGYSVIPQNIQLICSAFGVSEKWLVTGKGKMYTNDEDAIIEKLTNKFNLTPEQEIFARHWLELPPDAREAVVEYVVGVVEAIRENQDTKKDESLDPSEPLAEMPTFCQPFANPAPAPQLEELLDDPDRPSTLSDDEWVMVQAMRDEKKKGSRACSSTNAELA